MPYSKQTWINGAAGATPINADRLNHIESGIDDASRGRYNVLSFGAVGDGVHDDHAAIMSAITQAVNAGGGTIFLPPGDYALSEPIAPVNMPTDSSAAEEVALLGLGWRGLIGYAKGGARLQAKGNYPVIGGWWNSCKIENLGLDAGYHGAPAISGDFSKTVIAFNELYNWIGYGMQLCTDNYKANGQPTYLNKIENNNIQQSDGIGLFASYLMWDSYIRFNNIGSTDTNIRTEGGPHKIHFNWLDGETGPSRNIHMLDVGHTTEIVGNYMENSHHESILLQRPSWETGSRRLSFKILGNQILNGGHDDSGDSAITVIGNAGADPGKLFGLLINDNQFFDDDNGHWQHAVSLQNLDSVAIIGNDWSGDSYLSDYAVRAVNCSNYEVLGNVGDNTVTTS